MRVFSQINNCQQKQNKKQEQKTDKTKRGAPPLGLAKSIYYGILNLHELFAVHVEGFHAPELVEYPL